MNTKIVIVAARRTVQGRYLGALADRSALDLALSAGKAIFEQGIGPENVELVVLGNVLAAGLGMNLARQLSVKLGVPLPIPAYTVNMMCASGMQAVALGAQAICAGEARMVLCGGTESMSNAPFLLDRARQGYRFGDGKLVDVILRDGLVDSFSHEHMGKTAEALACRYGIPREEQDAFALRSHQRYFAAFNTGRYSDELVAVGSLSRDEHPRSDASLEKLRGLKPAFDSQQGTVTAGNASGINDGAALLLLADAALAQERGWTPLAEIEGIASVGCEPEWMGLGPVHAARKLCAQLGCAITDFDTIEINEAFAAQALACMRELQLDGERINPDGGAIAIGHPLGASGARLVAHLAHCIHRGHSRRALAALCVGGGMGIAMALRAV